VKRLLILRHGESTSDPERRVGGDYDDDLTDRGRDQARRLADRLAREYRIDLLYASPLKRAVQTADAITAATAVIASLDARLRERGNGELAGLTYAERARRYSPPPPGGWRPFHRPPGGETALEHFARVSDFYYRLREGAVDKEPSGVPAAFAIGPSRPAEAGSPAQMGAPTDGEGTAPAPEAVAIVGHGGTNQLLIRLLVGLALDAPLRFGMGDTSINEFEFGERGTTVVRMNDTSHLL
jgi:broad specificity phosphatase PhoE